MVVVAVAHVVVAMVVEVVGPGVVILEGIS